MSTAIVWLVDDLQPRAAIGSLRLELFSNYCSAFRFDGPLNRSFDLPLTWLLGLCASPRSATCPFVGFLSNISSYFPLNNDSNFILWFDIQNGKQIAFDPFVSFVMISSMIPFEFSRIAMNFLHFFSFQFSSYFQLVTFFFVKYSSSETLIKFRFDANPWRLLHSWPQSFRWFLSCDWKTTDPEMTIPSSTYDCIIGSVQSAWKGDWRAFKRLRINCSSIKHFLEGKCNFWSKLSFELPNG